MEDKARWLLSVIKHPQIDAARMALVAGASPDTIDPETQQPVLQLAIHNDNVALFQLLMEGIPGKTANVNMVGHNFEASIDFAAKANVTNKFAFMKMLIEKRTSFSREELHTYVAICAMRLGHVPLQQQDFAMMAHYVSRMCGIHLGNLLNYDNNPDRYLVHLCQYSYAEKDSRELEGWYAIEFLPIRIFSLFETLVKLKKGYLSVDEKKITEHEEILTKEILLEVESFKLLQESEAIAAAKGITEKEREQLYDILAGVFLTRLKNNPGKEFSIASGYKGHSFYISFMWAAVDFVGPNECLIRYENLGAGIEKLDGSLRHTIRDGKVYPKEIAVPISNEQKLRNYIKKLFEIKQQAIEGSDYKELRGNPREERQKVYRRFKEEKLVSIYDDNNELGYRVLLLNTPGMREQEADTCVATSHQVGLLIRTKDESFYEWVVAEEKRAIVQVNRNEGADLAHQDIFWQMEDKIDFDKMFLYPQFCPEILDDAYKMFRHCLWRINRDFVEDIDKHIPVKNNEFETLWLNLGAKLRDFSANNNVKANMFVMLLIGVLAMKKGITVSHGIDKFKTFQLAYDLFSAGGTEYLNTAYCLALSAFFIGDNARAKQVFSICLDYIENYKKMDQQNRGRYLESIGIGSRFGLDMNDESYVWIMESNILRSLGFVNIALGNYDEAERVFKCIERKSHTVIYFPDASLGLGIIYDYKFRQNQNPLLAKLASEYLGEIKSEAKPSIYHTAKQMMQNLLAHYNELNENTKKRKLEQMESSSGPQAPTAPQSPPAKRQKTDESSSIGDNSQIFLATKPPVAQPLPETAAQAASVTTTPQR